MKNCFKRSIIFFATATLLVGSAAAQDLKVATVNVEALFKDYHRTDVEQKKIAEEFARISKENNDRLETMRDLEVQLVELRKKIEDPTIAEKLRTSSKTIFQTKLNEAKAIEQERKDSFGRRSSALNAEKSASIQSIRDEILKEIIDHSKTEAYDYVFDESGLSQNMIPFLIYKKDALDVTADVLAKLNKNAPAK